MTHYRQVNTQQQTKSLTYDWACRLSLSICLSSICLSVLAERCFIGQHSNKLIKLAKIPEGLGKEICIFADFLFYKKIQKLKRAAKQRQEKGGGGGSSPFCVVMSLKRWVCEQRGKKPIAPNKILAVLLIHNHAGFMTRVFYGLQPTVLILYKNEPFLYVLVTLYLREGRPQKLATKLLPVLFFSSEDSDIFSKIMNILIAE